MFLPIGDRPNPPSRPYVTIALIALNVTVYVLITLPLNRLRPDFNDPLLLEYVRSMASYADLNLLLQNITAYDLVVFKYGFRPASPSPVSLLTSLFLHGNLAHLAGNMLFLWIFGDNVEHRLGRIGFLFTYLAGGVLASLFFALFVPGSSIPLVGASGAISAILGCYFIWFPHNQVKVFIFLFPILMTTVMIPAKVVLGFYLLVDNLLPFLLTTGQGAGVAHGAHIGGFIAGLALAFGLGKRSKAS
jgi:rhomboid family protein